MLFKLATWAFGLKTASKIVINRPNVFVDFRVALLCRFLYSDEVHIDPETVMTTLYTAKKYAVPALEGYCVEFLTKHLRADNAFILLTQVIFIAYCLPDSTGLVCR